ncbi:MAG: MFS transporter [Labedaea sp.]
MDRKLDTELEAGAPRATRREWIGLAVLALPTLLLSLDISVLYLALPRLATGLGANATQQLWILDIYSFMVAGFLVTMGTLGDRIGRRRLLLIGAGTFGAASILCAYATSPEMLIVARALLGIAGATMMPSSMALIRNMFRDAKQMAAALGVWFACFMGGMALGPLVGGALLEHFWWGSAFLLGVPFMVLLLITGPVLLPEYRDAGAGRLDLVSVGLSLAAILPVIYGLKSLARNGWQPVSGLTIAAGLALGYVFVRRQRRLEHPLLDLRLFRSAVFATAFGSMLFGGIVMSGATLMSTLYLQAVTGLSPLRAGLWMVPVNVGLVLGSLLGPALASRFPASRVIMVGLATSGVGLLVQTQVQAVGGLPALITGLVLATFGVSVPMALTMNVILRAAPPEKAGSAASLQETGGEFGVAVGVAAMGSLGTAVYRGELAGTLPAGVPDGARESLTAAVAVAHDLPARLGAELLDAARAAFTAGLNTVALAGGVIFLGLAVVAGIVLGRDERTTAGNAQVANAVDEIDHEEIAELAATP